jgi:hypothetical protein
MQDRDTSNRVFRARGLQFAGADLDLVKILRESSPRKARVVLETLLIFLALVGSFALVGLLVRFAENVIHPADDMASADRRDKKA